MPFQLGNSMEKLLKNVYQLYRKEVKGLKEELEMVKQNAVPRDVHACKNCAKLQEKLQRLTEAYDKLLLESKNGYKKCDYPTSETGSETVGSDVVVDSDQDEDLCPSQNKIISVFDEKSQYCRSPKANSTTSEENFSPVPETPDALMNKVSHHSPIVIMETVDDYAAPPQIMRKKNHPSSNSFNETLTPSNLYVEIPPVNTVAKLNKTVNVPRPGAEIISPVFGSCVTDDLNDSSDFEIPRTFKRRREEPKVSKSSKIKIPAVKHMHWKPSKPTASNAKYSFEAARPGFKKPKYKQITLSQTVGEMFKSTSKIDQIKLVNKNTNKTSEDDDLDATYVPSQDLPPKPDGHCKLSLSNGKQHNEIASAVELDESEESSSSEDLLPKQPLNTRKCQQPSSSYKLPSDYFDDYDEVPKNDSEPKYKYVRDAVRKKVDREKLDGQTCYQCDKYYSNLGLTGSQKKLRMNSCSKHRDKYERPRTPEHFWSVDFPDTQEQDNKATSYKPPQRRLTRIRK